MNVYTLTYTLFITNMLKIYIRKKDSIISTLVPWDTILSSTVGMRYAHGNTDRCVREQPYDMDKIKH